MVQAPEGGKCLPRAGMQFNLIKTSHNHFKKHHREPLRNTFKKYSRHTSFSNCQIAFKCIPVEQDFDIIHHLPKGETEDKDVIVIDWIGG